MQDAKNLHAEGSTVSMAARRDRLFTGWRARAALLP
jgi:hypothetical protein